MKELFSVFIFEPLYNALIFFIDVVPGGDVGIAVILLTLSVKCILFPISIKAARTQVLMKEMEEPLKEVQERYKDDKQKQAQEVMALYKEKGANPFSSIALIFIQLPIIFGLYWVFARGGLPTINADILYSFIPFPQTVDMEFMGIVDMAGKSIVLAFLAGFTQFIHARMALPIAKPKKEGEEPSFKDDFARSLQLQMRYVLPIIIAVVAYTISAAVALYWTTSNIFTIGQEWYVKRNIRKPQETEN